LPSLSWRKVIKALNKAGFKIVHVKGSHIFLTDGKHKITVPHHETIKKGTLLSIKTIRNDRRRISETAEKIKPSRKPL